MKLVGLQLITMVSVTHADPHWIGPIKRKKHETKKLLDAIRKRKIASEEPFFLEHGS